MIAWLLILLSAPPTICAPGVGLDPRPTAPCLSSTGDVIYLPALQFRVHWGKWTLRPRSRTVVQAAARLIQAGPPMRAAVHAHTHQPDRYSIRVGQRRGWLVVAELVAAGIPAERIEVIDFGEEQPMFSTRGPDNIKNRRIEIHLRPLR